MIIAVDFDGVLCEDEFPNIGSAKESVINIVKGLIMDGHEVILWTCRVEKELEDAVKWCADHGLHFSAVNDNADSNKKQYAGVYSTSPRKVYADFYIDDKNIEYPGNPSIFEIRRFANGNR